MTSAILADLPAAYGMIPDEIVPVNGGWLNKKWRIRCKGRDLLIKQYSAKRYNMERQRTRLEPALQRQLRIEDAIPCPHLLTSEGRVLRTTDDGTTYMVMEFVPGYTVTFDTVTLPQLRNLGEVCARMHNAFSTLPVQGVEGYPFDSARMLSDLRANFRARIHDCPDDAPVWYRRAVLGQEFILNSLTPAYMDSLPKCIAHEDFSPDNMLFDDHGVAAILDFDRNHYSFRWHDLGRAILSLAWKNGRLDADRVHALMDGYAGCAPLTMADLPDILRLTWCIEVPWWIQPMILCEGSSPKILRFRDELVWLTENWFALDSVSI
ncbi:MAG: phosphotransferase [Clostridia bacterium]|nr:phosphotransferase [Clostridia bacterium]